MTPAKIKAHLAKIKTVADAAIRFPSNVKLVEIDKKKLHYMCLKDLCEEIPVLVNALKLALEGLEIGCSCDTGYYRSTDACACCEAITRVGSILGS